MSGTHKLDLGRESLISLSSKVVTMLFGIVGLIIFARILGPVGLGAYYFALAAGKITAQISSGLAEAIKKRVSEVDEKPQEYLGVGLLCHGLLTGITYLVLLLTSSIVNQFIDIDRFVVSTTLVVFSFGLFQIIQGIYIGVGNPGTASWFDAFRSVLTTLSQVGFLVFFGWGSFGLIAGFSTAAIVTSLSVWIVSRIRPAVPSMRTLRRTYSFAQWSIPDSLIGNVYSRLDVLLLGVIVGSEAVGYYETALRLVQPAALFASSISSPLLVKTSGLSSLDRDVLPDLNNAFSYTALIAIPIFFGTLALPKSLMSIFSPEFASGGQLLIGLGLLQIFRTLASPLNSIINATDNPHIEFRISIVVTCLNLVAAVISGYQIGAIGVVGAAVAAEAIRFGSYQLFMRDNFAQIVFTKFVAIEILSGFIMFMPIYFLAPFLQPQTNPISLAGLILLGATVYFGLLIVLTDEFRTTVKSIIKPFYITTVNK